MNREIYYKRYDPEPTAIYDVHISEPIDFGITAYPNPFNSNLNIIVNSKEEGTIDIYDILGRIIKEFTYSKGQTSLIWNADDLNNNPVSSGMYFIKMKGGGGKRNIRVLYLR